MSETIWKYNLTNQHTLIQMPEGAEIICIQVQDSTPCIWAIVDPNKPLMPRHFERIGTGWDLWKNTHKYIGTYQEPGYVWHVFETQYKL
jgi:hypothetical protein